MRKQQLEVLTEKEARELDEKINKEFLAKKGECIEDIEKIEKKWLGIVKVKPLRFEIGTFLNKFINMPQSTYQLQIKDESHMKKGKNYEKLKNFLEL